MLFLTIRKKSRLEMKPYKEVEFRKRKSKPVSKRKCPYSKLYVRSTPTPGPPMSCCKALLLLSIVPTKSLKKNGILYSIILLRISVSVEYIINLKLLNFSFKALNNYISCSLKFPSITIDFSL